MMVMMMYIRIIDSVVVIMEFWRNCRFLGIFMFLVDWFFLCGLIKWLVVVVVI